MYDCNEKKSNPKFRNQIFSRIALCKFYIVIVTVFGPVYVRFCVCTLAHIRSDPPIQNF